MLKLKKVFNSKTIILILTVVFFLNIEAVVYGEAIFTRNFKKTLLRKPLDFNNRGSDDWRRYSISVNRKTKLGLNFTTDELSRHNKIMDDMNKEGNIAGFALGKDGQLRVMKRRHTDWAIVECIVMRRIQRENESISAGDFDIYSLGFVPVVCENGIDGKKCPAIYMKKDVDGKTKAVRLTLEEIEQELGLALVLNEKNEPMTIKGFVRLKQGDTARVLTIPGAFGVVMRERDKIVTLKELEDISKEDADELSEMKAQGDLCLYRNTLIAKLLEKGLITIDRTKACAYEYKGFGSKFRHYSNSRNEHLGDEVEGKYVIILGSVGTFPEGFGIAGQEEVLAQEWQRTFEQNGASLSSIIVFADPLKARAKEGKYCTMSRRLAWGTTLRLDEVNSGNDAFMELLKDSYPNVDNKNRLLYYYIEDVAYRLGRNVRAVLDSGFVMNSGANELNNYGVWGDLADIGGYADNSNAKISPIRYIAQVKNILIELCNNLNISKPIIENVQQIFLKGYNLEKRTYYLVLPTYNPIGTNI